MADGFAVKAEGGRLVVDYRKRAEECRERAKRGGKPADWGHFLEMSRTWEMLANLHELSQKLKSSGALKEARPRRGEDY
jgi:hypothetical protein